MAFLSNVAAGLKSTLNQMISTVSSAAQSASPKKKSTTTAAVKSTAASPAKSKSTSSSKKSSGSSSSATSTPATTPPTMQDYQNSAFYTSANIPALQAQLAAYNVSDDKVRQQAEAMYAPAYNMQKTAFENQLAQLDLSRNRDIQKINSQYDKSLNSVMAGLNKQGLGRSSLVFTRGAETENARNAAVSETSYNYLQQQNEINSNMQQAEADYAQSVENKAAEIRERNRSQQIGLMAQIAQLQQTGYSSYVEYLLNKDK